MQVRLSIIIPTKDRGNIFYNTLSAAYSATSDIDCEIIIVNDSKTNSINVDEKFGGRVTVLNNPKSGVASARNYGAKFAKGDWLIFLDDDMILFKRNIESYFKYFSTNERVCVNIDWEYPPNVIEDIRQNVFGRFLIKNGFTTLRGWNNYPNWPLNSSIPVESVASPNLLIKRMHFIDTNGYDENFPFAGFEDYVFSKRLEEQHFKMFVDTNSIMYHNEIDRLEMDSWLLRKERGSETRKIAVENGFGEIQIKYNFFKTVIYSCNFIFVPFLKGFVKLTGRFKTLDSVSFACYNFLLGTYIYKGYNK